MYEHYFQCPYCWEEYPCCLIQVLQTDLCGRLRGLLQSNTVTPHFLELELVGFEAINIEQ